MSKRTRACHGFQGAKLVRHLSGHAGRFHHARNVLVFIHNLQKPESFFDSFYYIEAHHILDCTKCCLHAVGMSWQRSLQDISTAASFKGLMRARVSFHLQHGGCTLWLQLCSALHALLPLQPLPGMHQPVHTPAPHQTTPFPILLSIWLSNPNR